MPPRVALCSMVNNGLWRATLARYIRQVEALDYPAEQLRVYLVEGDSADETWLQVQGWARRNPRARVAKFDLGHPIKGSVEDADRLLDASTVGSFCRGLALSEGWAEWILWIESDLLWDAQLLNKLLAVRAEVVAPWVLTVPTRPGVTDVAVLEQAAPAERVFYDVWAFRHRADQRRFTAQEPRPAQPFAVHSAGSCLLMSAEVAREANQPSEHAIVGWCEQARARGTEVWCDPRLTVWHRMASPQDWQPGLPPPQKAISLHIGVL
jgi:hypothetical protein